MGEPVANTYEDYIATPFGGMDSGRLSRLLPPSKAAFLSNVTMRDGFPTDRPKFRKLDLTFDAGIQSAVESGLFQGGGYFRAQSGISSLMASIAGRLFQFTPSLDSATVSERTISGDPNSATISQAWFWQAEMWGILTDGDKLSIFVDDTTSRRSNGPAVNLGATSAAFTVPAVGSNVTITLAANYTGPLNAVVTIGSGNYIVVAVGTPPGGTGGYEASIKNINATPGAALAVGTPVISPGSTNVIGTTAIPFNVPSSPNDTFMVQFTSSVSFPGSSAFWMAGRRYKFWGNVDISQFKYNLRVIDDNDTGSTITVPAGTQATYPESSPITQPAYTIGSLVVAATVPAVNASVAMFLDTLYAGAANQPVTINGKSYRITAVAQAPPTPSTTIIVKNLTDTDGNSVAIGKALLTIPELGIGRMGTYGKGRNWMSLIDGISFTASDLVGESSGSSAYNYRDAVLKTTKNQFLYEGKPFRVPNSGETIQGMAFAAQLDTAMGTGPLQVFTDVNVFSCNAPIDSAQWATLTSPILTEPLKGAGGVSHESIVNSNSDIRFRSSGGIRSYQLARLDFHKWGDTLISHEMQRVIDLDEVPLLNYCSAIDFDNRMLTTCNPVQHARGVYHRGLIVINDDEISSMSEKSPPIYDGLWTGLNILRLIKGRFSGVERAFAFCVNTDEAKIELWEILQTGEEVYDDGDERVVWSMETADLFRGQSGSWIDKFKALEDGEMSVGDVQGEVGFKVYYKPDQYPGWILWHEWSVETDMNSANSQPGYFPRMGFGKPSSKNKNDLNNYSTRYGYTFQIRVVVTGHCRILGGRVSASKQAQPQFAKPICGNEPSTNSIQIESLDDFAQYSLNSSLP